MNQLSAEKRKQVIASVVDRNSIRATCRMTGAACTVYQNEALKNLPCKRIQCDEIWSLCYSKEKNVPKKQKGRFGFGDLWTGTAICSYTKIVLSWYIGNRDLKSAKVFMNDLASRLSNRVKLTTDGHKPYLSRRERFWA